MALLTPTYADYCDASEDIGHFCNNKDLEYCIYGSFINPSKLKPGLSDIDFFVIQKITSLQVDIELMSEFGELKNNISSLGIPLQCKFATQGGLNLEFLTPGTDYIQEVKRGIAYGVHSTLFPSLIGNGSERNSQFDNYTMLHNYLRKISLLGSLLPEIKTILKKEKSDLSFEDQKKLQKLWDSFKKIISFYTLSLRILKKESLFSKDDKSNIQYLEESFGIENIDFTSLLNILSKVKNISDWFEYLKKGGIEEIKSIYTNSYIPSLPLILDKINI